MVVLCGILPLVVLCCLSAVGSGRVTVSGWLLPLPGGEGRGRKRRDKGGGGRRKREEGEGEGERINLVRDIFATRVSLKICKQQIFPQPESSSSCSHHTCSTFNCCWVASLKRMSSLSSFSNSAFTFSTPPDCSVIIHASPAALYALLANHYVICKISNTIDLSWVTLPAYKHPRILHSRQRVSYAASWQDSSDSAGKERASVLPRRPARR